MVRRFFRIIQAPDAAGRGIRIAVRGAPRGDRNSRFGERGEAGMLDREKIVAVLRKRFAGAGADQIAAATNAIVGLPDDEWEELTVPDAAPCSESCLLARAIQDGTRFKVLQRRPNHGR